MIKWGTTFGSHDGALAVFQDNELVFASDAERWSRKKNDSIIPGRLIEFAENKCCLLYTSPSPRDATLSRMPSSA